MRPWVFLLILSLAACQKQEGAGPEKGPQPGSVDTAVVVSVAKANRQDLEVYIPLTGTLRASTEVDISSKIPGKLEKVKVEVGDTVKKGEVLATLERRDAVLQIKQAEAQMKSARASLKQAEIDAERFEKLAASGAATEAELTGTLTRKSVSASTLETAEATLALAKETLNNSTLKAPIKGVITRRNAEIGQTVSPGVPLFTLHDLESMILEAGVAERDLGRISVGQEAKMTVEAYPGQVFQGKLTIIGRSLDPATRKVPVQIEFPNPDGKLLSQMYARATLQVTTITNALVVPESALLELRDQPPNPSGSQPAGEIREVWVVEDGVAHKKQVSVGAIVNGLGEILSGLSEEEVVVTGGHALLKEGSKVQIVGEKNPKALRSPTPSQEKEIADTKEEIQ